MESLIQSTQELAELYREQREYLSKELERVKIERDEAAKEALYYKTRYELLKDSRELIQ